MKQQGQTSGGRLALAAGLLAALGVGGYLLFFATPEAPPPAAPTEAPAAPGPPGAPAADADSVAQLGVEPEVSAPTPDGAVPGIPVTAPAAELPALTASDTSIRPELLALLGENAMTRWLQQEQLIQRITAQVAGLQRGAFSYTPRCCWNPRRANFWWIAATAASTGVRATTSAMPR